MFLVPRPLYALVALGLLALVLLSWPGLFAALGVNPGGVFDDASLLDRELRRGDRLDAGWDEARSNVVERGRLIRELAAGRVSVPEAARRFWELRVAPDKCIQNLLRWEKGSSDEERLCRHVILWIREELADRPEEAERAIVLREEELAKHLAKHGRVILPGGKLSFSDDDSGR